MKLTDFIWPFIQPSDQKFIPPAFEKSNLMTFIIIKETLFLPAKYLIMDGELSKVRDFFGPLHYGAELFLPGALEHWLHVATDPDLIHL